MNVSVANFIKHIVIDLLGKSLTSKEYKNLGGSQNTLRQCVDRNKGIGDAVIEIISNLVISETRFDISKRNQILDYLNQFLTLNEKGYSNRNPDDIKTILRCACKNLVKSKNRSGKSKFRIADMDELEKMGWTIKDMLQANINLDFETIPFEKEEHNGTFEQWYEIYKKNADCIRWLLDEENNVVGYWHFEPLFWETYLKAKNGKLLETEVTFDKIPLMLPSTYNIYFIGICLKERLRRRTETFGKLLYSIIDVLEILAKRKVFINEICALAYSTSGIRLCQSIGLRYINDHAEHGKIYCGKMVDLLKKDFCQDYIGLKEMYRNKDT